MRNTYEPKGGVTRLRWSAGVPSTDQSPVIVEVWDAALYSGTPAPQLAIHAKTEVWVWHLNKWHRLSWQGSLVEATSMGMAREVRRWAPMASRSWHGNATLDGWNAEKAND